MYFKLHPLAMSPRQKKNLLFFIVTIVILIEGRAYWGGWGEGGSKFRAVNFG